MTLRRLWLMADARRRDEWDRVSWIVAAVVNQNRKRSDAVRPSDVNPMLQD